MIKRVLMAISLLVLMSSQSYATILYNQDVTPSLFYGSGNTNGGFNVDTENGIEVGLRTHLRAPTPSDTNVQSVNGTFSYLPGVTTLANSSSTTLYSYWNFDYAVNLGNLNTTGLTVKLGLDIDPTAGQNFKYITLPTQSLQDSQNFNFTWLTLPQYFGLQTGAALIDHATWDFRLNVSDSSGTLAETDMTVLIGGGAPGAPVPEPSTIFLLGLGLAGLAVRQFRKKS